MRPIIFCAILVCACFLSTSVAVAQGKVPPERATAEKTQVESRGGSSLSADDVTALREDIARMRAILNQMETNLAFVDTTQSPLKHQFQLEIDMWNNVIAEMERRLKTQTK